MGFEVNPDAVAAYADVLRKQAEHQDEAIKYLDKHIDVGVSKADGLITTAEEYNPAIVEAVRKAIKNARTFFEDSADAMRETADYYARTDAEVAEKLDRTYEAGESIEVETPGPANVTLPGEVVDPTEALKAPGKPEKFDNGPFELVEKFNGALSPATYIRELVKALNDGKDIFDEAIKEISGDWEAFAKASKACEHLSEFYMGTCANVRQYAPLAYYWTGNASDLAVYFFHKAADNFFNDDYLPTRGDCTQEEPEGVLTPGTEWGYAFELWKLGEGYLTMAQDVSEFAGAANSALNNIIDTLSWSLLAAGGGAAMSWTGVGALTGAGLASLLMGKTISHISDFTTAIANIKSALDSFSMLDSSGAVADLEHIELPKPYKTPEGM